MAYTASRTFLCYPRRHAQLFLLASHMFLYLLENDARLRPARYIPSRCESQLSSGSSYCTPCSRRAVAGDFRSRGIPIAVFVGREYLSIWYSTTHAIVVFIMYSRTILSHLFVIGRLYGMDGRRLSSNIFAISMVSCRQHPPLLFLIWNRPVTLSYNSSKSDAISMLPGFTVTPSGKLWLSQAVWAQ